ncbi:hypothetical protein BBJ28_00013725 [Nothophytophthora sp. Chile5]|nr:hypothetical protein BBJ28_00013725 [Nothophytophthora sp. Chile5]
MEASVPGDVTAERHDRGVERVSEDTRLLLQEKRPSDWREKALLLKELEVLQAQVAQLRKEAKRNARQNDNRSLLQKELTSGFLREAIQLQQVSLVTVQSALSGCVSAQERLPYEMDIHLGADLEQRRDELASLKSRKTQASQAYLAERTRFLDCMSPSSESSRFATLDGGYCALHFDITPFEGVESVKKVYDALLFYYSNMEIRVTEILGDVTIREDDDSAGLGISQCRLVSYLSNGVQLETNNVMFTEFREDDVEFGDGRAFGVFTSDSVNDDGLYPYIPSQRVRQDMTSTVTVKAYKREKQDAVSQDEELVVVMTRSCLLKIHPTQLQLPPAAVHELREGVGQWGDVMLQSVRELVYIRPERSEVDESVT